MINLLYLAGNPADATSAHRCVQPIEYLKRTWPELQTNSVFTTNGLAITPNTLVTLDGVFLQRPCTRDHAVALNMAKECGVPSWVDYDDDIFDIPDSNLSRDTYEHYGWLQQAAECIRLADIVSVSTPALERSFRARFGDNLNIRVIPNGFDDFFTRPFFQNDNPRDPARPEIAYRGSNTHPGDLGIVGDRFAAMSDKHPDWHWTFFGYTPPGAKKIPEQRRMSAPWSANMYVYLANLRACAPDVMFFPLQDHPFNHCKANMCLMEAAWAGAPLICPDWEEWRIPGAINYKSEAECANVIDLVMSGEFDLRARAKESWDWVVSNRTLTKTNELRKKLIQDLVALK